MRERENSKQRGIVLQVLLQDRIVDIPLVGQLPQIVPYTIGYQPDHSGLDSRHDTHLYRFVGAETGLGLQQALVLDETEYPGLHLLRQYCLGGGDTVQDPA